MRHVCPLRHLAPLALAALFHLHTPAHAAAPQDSWAPDARAINELTHQESLRRAASHEYALRRLPAAEAAMHARQYTEVIRICNAILTELGTAAPDAVVLAKTRRLLTEGHYGEARRLRAAQALLPALSHAHMAQQMGHPRAAKLIDRINNELARRKPPR